MKFSIFLSVLFLFVSCASNAVDNLCGNNNISIKNDVLYLDGKIDTSSVKLMFDSGCLIGCLIPDSTASRIALNGGGRVNEDDIAVINVDSISVCGFPHGSNSVNVIDGSFRPQIAPLYESDDRIWHFSLDSMMLTIANTPFLYQDKLEFPIIFTKRKGKKNAPMVNIPITYSQDDDRIETSYYYLLDTGTPYGFVMTDPPVEMKEFVARIKHNSFMDEMSIKNKNRIIKQFELNFEISDVFVNNVLCEFDTAVRSFNSEFGHKFDHADKPLVGTIGMRFLKHFNFDIDLKNQKLVLRPTTSVFPSKSRNENGFWCNAIGVVQRLEIDGKAYKNGLRVGDSIISIDNIPFHSFTKEQRDSIIYHNSRMELQLSNGRTIYIH